MNSILLTKVKVDSDSSVVMDVLIFTRLDVDAVKLALAGSYISCEECYEVSESEVQQYIKNSIHLTPEQEMEVEELARRNSNLGGN